MYVAFRVINKIFVEVDKCIAEDKVITDLNMCALPDLYNKFVELVSYLVRITHILPARVN
jgi:callose synthase